MRVMIHLSLVGYIIYQVNARCVLIPSITRKFVADALQHMVCLVLDIAKQVLYENIKV